MSKDKEDPILRDEAETTGKDRKRLRIVTILLVVFVLLMLGGVALDIVFGMKLSDKKQLHEDTEARLKQLQAEEEKMKLDRNLDLSNTNLLDFSLELNEPAGPGADAIVENLNLTNNLLKAFHFNKVHSLKQLYLEGNNITEFAYNRLDALEKFSIDPLKQLVNFTGNNMPTVTSLQVSEIESLIYFNGNVLDGVVNLSLPINLREFNDNHLQNLQNLDLSMMNQLTSLNGNYLPITSLTLDNPALVNFAQSTFPNLKNLVILRNNFSNINVVGFAELTTININSPTQNGNTSSLSIRHTPKLTQLTVVLPMATNAWIQNTSLTSFPDANSNLVGLKSLVLQDNELLTTLFVSKMPNVEDYEIINTPIDKTDPDAIIKELEFSDTSLKAFRGWMLKQLESLILQRNKNMTAFSDNDLPKLKTLVIANQSFTESKNNSFPSLQELKLTGTPLSTVSFLTDPTKLLNIELVDTSPPIDSTFDVSVYPNLKGLLINNNFTGLLLDNPALTNVVINVPTLQQLTVRNSQLTNLNTIENFTNLRKLEVSSSAVNGLNTSRLNDLTDLYLDSIPLNTLNTINMVELTNVSITNLPLTTLSFQNMNFLTALNLRLEQLTSLDVSYSKITNFEGHSLPALTSLILNSDILTELALFDYPELTTLSMRIPNLTNLQIADCKVRNLDSCTLDNLDYLTFSNVPIDYFNQRFTKLKTLAINDIDNPTLRLDFSDTPLLSNLELLNNGIVALYLSNMEALTTLHLGTPNLTNLTLQGMSALTNITFDRATSMNSFKILSVDAVAFFTTFKDQDWPTLNSLTIKNCPTTDFSNNVLPALTALELTNLPLASDLSITYSTLTQLILNIPAFNQALHLENVAISSLENCTLDSLTTLTIKNVASLTKFTTFPAVTMLGLEEVKIDTFDFSWVPKVKYAVLLNSPIRKLAFPASLTDLFSIRIENVTAQGGISGQNLPAVTQVVVKASPEFDEFRNNILSQLTELTLDGTAADSIQDNTMPKLDRLTFANTLAQPAGIPSIFGFTAPVSYYWLENLNLSSFGNQCDLTKLKELYIKGNNRVDKLLIGTATLLERLVVENSYLVNFTGFTLPNLLSLDIHDTGVLANFSGFSANKLQSITLSGISKIPLLNISGVDLQALQQLVVRDSPGYKQFQGHTFGNLTLLQVINCPSFDTFTGNTLANLVTLDLRSNALSVFSDQSLQKVRSLTLHQNSISEFKNNTLSSIEQLDLGVNNLSTTDDLFANATDIAGLRLLNLEHNALTNFFSVNLPNLENLNVGSNQLIDFNGPVSPNLKILKIDNNSLSLINGINYPALQEFWVSNNQFSSGGDVSTLPLLTTLKFANNKIANFTPGLQHDNLQYLELQGNQIVEFGQPNLPRLLSLDLSNNQLTDADLLKSLTATNINVGLKYLNIAGNLIAQKDVTVGTLQASFPNAQIIA